MLTMLLIKANDTELTCLAPLHHLCILHLYAFVCSEWSACSLGQVSARQLAFAQSWATFKAVQCTRPVSHDITNELFWYTSTKNADVPTSSLQIMVTSSPQSWHLLPHFSQLREEFDLVP